ncbi:MAG: hypothetical protein J0M26_06440 [Planctomycetes bacterium]|nr:hypothetical protein [Planctomycetota bacterium]
MKKYFLIFSTMIALILAVGQKDARAGLILSMTNDPTHIAMAADRDYVMPFMRGSDQFNLEFGGSITIIDDGRWGLTAKHQVLQNFNNLNSTYNSFAALPGDKVIFSVDGSINTDGKFTVQEVFVHPTRDLALVYFGNPVAGINPVQRFTGNVTVGMEGYNAGFGVREFVNDTNPPVFTGDRRAGFDVIETVNNDVFRTRNNFTFSSSFRQFEMGGRNGDSGGGFILESMIDTDNDGVPDTLNRELLGIIAGGSNFNIPGASTFYQMQDNDWIDVTKSSVTSVPEPSSFLTLGSLLLGGASRRFFKRKRSN